MFAFANTGFRLFGDGEFNCHDGLAVEVQRQGVFTGFRGNMGKIQLTVVIIRIHPHIPPVHGLVSDQFGNHIAVAVPDDIQDANILLGKLEILVGMEQNGILSYGDYILVSCL